MREEGEKGGGKEAARRNGAGRIRYGRAPLEAKRKCPYLDAEEERLARGEIATEQFRLLRSKLPVLLGRLEKIRDPRNPKKIKYAISLLMTYGILIFVFQMSSRRQANETMTRPMFLENLRLFLPELESLPHCDTLARLLEKIDAGENSEGPFRPDKGSDQKKKFARYLIKGRYPVAVDGTGKLSGSRLWDENLLERAVPGDSDEKRYCVYVLEASLAFSNSMRIPFASVFSELRRRGSRLGKTGLRTQGLQKTFRTSEEGIQTPSDNSASRRPVSERPGVRGVPE